MARNTTIPKKTIKELLKVLPEYQVRWLQFYYDETTFEPMNIDELLDGTMSFEEVFKVNVDWFETWSSDAMNQVSREPDAEGWSGRGGRMPRFLPNGKREVF